MALLGKTGRNRLRKTPRLKAWARALESGFGCNPVAIEKLSQMTYFSGRRSFGSVRLAPFCLSANTTTKRRSVPERTLRARFLAQLGSLGRIRKANLTIESKNAKSSSERKRLERLTSIDCRLKMGVQATFQAIVQVFRYFVLARKAWRNRLSYFVGPFLQFVDFSLNRF